MGREMLLFGYVGSSHKSWFPVPPHNCAAVMEYHGTMLPPSKVLDKGRHRVTLDLGSGLKPRGLRTQRAYAFARLDVLSLVTKLNCLHTGASSTT